MVMFDRKKNELPPLKYNIGDKVMGYHTSMGGQMLAGGVIVEVTQSTSYLNDNEYKVKLEPELCDGAKEDLFWWLNEKEAQPFNQDIWNKAIKHWMEHNRLRAKSYLAYVRMHKALRGENDDISDEKLQKELDEKHRIKG